MVSSTSCSHADSFRPLVHLVHCVCNVTHAHALPQRAVSLAHRLHTFCCSLPPCISFPASPLCLVVAVSLQFTEQSIRHCYRGRLPVYRCARCIYTTLGCITHTRTKHQALTTFFCKGIPVTITPSSNVAKFLLQNYTDSPLG